MGERLVVYRVCELLNYVNCDTLSSLQAMMRGTSLLAVIKKKTDDFVEY